VLGEVRVVLSVDGVLGGGLDAAQHQGQVPSGDLEGVDDVQHPVLSGQRRLLLR
jgi:hypothetical protein